MGKFNQIFRYRKAAVSSFFPFLKRQKQPKRAKTPADGPEKRPRRRRPCSVRYALSDRANAGRVAVVEFGITEPSTKAAVAALAPITADKFTTVVFTRDNINEWLSVRNIPTVHPIFVDQLNTYDVITSQYVVFTKEAFEAFVAAKTEPKEA